MSAPSTPAVEAMKGRWRKGAAEMSVVSFHKGNTWKVKWGDGNEELLPTHKLVWMLDGAQKVTDAAV